MKKKKHTNHPSTRQTTCPGVSTHRRVDVDSLCYRCAVDVSWRHWRVIRVVLPPLLVLMMLMIVVVVVVVNK